MLGLVFPLSLCDHTAAPDEPAASHAFTSLCSESYLRDTVTVGLCCVFGGHVFAVFQSFISSVAACVCPTSAYFSSLFYVTDEVKYKVSSAMKINGLGAKRLIGL